MVAYAEVLTRIERPPDWMTAAHLPHADGRLREIGRMWDYTLKMRQRVDEKCSRKMLLDAGLTEAQLTEPMEPSVRRVLDALIFAKMQTRFVFSSESRFKRRKIPPILTGLIAVTCLRHFRPGRSLNSMYLAAAGYLNEGAPKLFPSPLDRDTIRREFLKFRGMSGPGALEFMKEAESIFSRLESIETKARAHPSFCAYRGRALFDALARHQDPVEGFLKKFVDLSIGDLRVLAAV